MPPPLASGYHREKLRLFFVSYTAELLCWLGLYFSGISQHLWDSSQSLAIYFFQLYALSCFVLIPFDYLRGYLLEKKYQMSRQTVASWMGDAAKKIILSFLFYACSYAVFYQLLSFAPTTWWLWAAALTMLFSLMISVIFPVIVAPLFYKIAPLANPELSAQIKDTCVRCGVSPMNSYEIKLSEKTVRVNAAVAGFGATRRVLLSDTLLRGFSKEEIRMVVAHEIGHHAKKHIGKGILLSAAMSLSGFYLISLWIPLAILENPVFLTMLLAVQHLAALFITPLMSSISRHHELEADAFALKIYPDLKTFESLMVKLSEKNLANPNPSALEEWFFYTHPSARNRIHAARRNF